MNARQMYLLMKRSGSIYADSYIQNKIRDDFGVVKRWSPVQPNETNGNCILYNRVEHCYMNENFRIGRFLRNNGISNFVWDDEAQVSLFNNIIDDDIFSEIELERIRSAWQRRNPNRRIANYHEMNLFSEIGILKDGDEDNSFTIGFELETVIQVGANRALNRRDEVIARSIDERLGHFSYDSSVSGVEFVSHTFTWEKLKKCKELFKKQFQEISESGLVASENAGLHIHIGRNAFRNNNSFKKFYYLLNLSTLQGNWEIFARRRSTQFCAYRSINNRDIACLNRMITHHRSSHSEAVNQQHANSIEVRIFKSTLSADILYASIEALIKLVEFCNSDNTTFKFKDLFIGEYSNKLTAFGIVTNPEDVNIDCLCSRSREELITLITQAINQNSLSEAHQLMAQLEEVINENEGGDQ